MARRADRQLNPPKPFTSPEQAAFVTLLRTAEQLQARNAEFLKGYELPPLNTTPAHPARCGQVRVAMQ